MSEFIVDRENIWPYGSQREEIVRCRDCKHYRPKISRTPGKRECWEAGEPFDREPGEYCSRGERKVVSE